MKHICMLSALALVVTSGLVGLVVTPAQAATITVTTTADVVNGATG